MLSKDYQFKVTKNRQIQYNKNICIVSFLMKQNHIT